MKASRMVGMLGRCVSRRSYLSVIKILEVMKGIID